MERIVLLGIIGSGKTTLASELSRRLNIPHIESDSISWGPNWTRMPSEAFIAQIDEKTRLPRWIFDGNQSLIREMVLSRADTLIWLDYSLWVVLGQLTRRTVHRLRSQQLLWGVNVERRFALVGHTASALRRYLKHHRLYPAAFCQPPYAHLQIIRLRSPRATQTWLAEIPIIATQ